MNHDQENQGTGAPKDGTKKRGFFSRFKKQKPAPESPGEPVETPIPTEPEPLPETPHVESGVGATEVETVTEEKQGFLANSAEVCKKPENPCPAV